jgi:hypothetical protein
METYDVKELRKIVNKVIRMVKEISYIKTKVNGKPNIDATLRTIDMYKEMMKANRIMMKLCKAPKAYINRLFILEDWLKCLQINQCPQTTTPTVLEKIIKETDAILDGALIEVQLIYLNLKSKVDKKIKNKPLTLSGIIKSLFKYR